MMVTLDTNVPIAANGRNTHASLECQLACVECLLKITAAKSRVRIALDENGLILEEYKQHFCHSGQPGVGDSLFKYLHDHMYQKVKVRLFSITPNDDEERGFEELPINTVDKSDRKFLATAVASGAEIVNALDTDWHIQQVFIADLGVTVKQLCPEHGCV